MIHTCAPVCDHTYTATQTNFKRSDYKGRKYQINLNGATFILTPLCMAAVTQSLTTPLCAGFFYRTFAHNTFAHSSHCSITYFTLSSLIIM